MTEKITIAFLFLFYFGNLNAQNKDSNLNNLLTEFYSEVSNQNPNKALKLSKRIDSLIPISEELNSESLAIYNNSKGFISYVNGLDPVPHLKKADSLNNLLTDPREDIIIYSSSILGLYFYEKNDYTKAINNYSKIINIKNISLQHNNYKLEALEKVFLMQRLELKKLSDSIQTKNTARRLIKFKKETNDTLSISYGNALSFIGKDSEAEKLFLAIKNIPRNSPNFFKYDKYQALFWLNNYYYSRLGNYEKISKSNAKKLIRVSEELLIVLENTDFMKPHQIYGVYGDLVVASIIINDDDRIKKYESKILKKLNDSNYLTDKEFDLKRFYFTLHKLKMYFEIYKNYEKAKFYAYKNVELTKFLYGEVSSEHEKELRSYENIIKLKMFDYDLAFKVYIEREKIIKKLFSEKSLEYLDILNQKYGLLINQSKNKEALQVMDKAIKISKEINCKDEKLCDEIKFSYLESLNSNELFDEVFEKFESYNFTNSYKSLFRISKIRRNAYYGLKNYLGINYEFEWLLNQIGENSSELLSNPDVEYEYYNFMTEYQEHLTSTGRLEKALSFTEKNKNIIQKCPFNFLKNKFTLNHIQILIELNRCKEALEIIETGNILTYSDLDTPISKSFYENQLYFKIGLVHSCLGNGFKSIEAFKRHLNYSEKENDLSFNVAYLELSRLYFENKDFSNSKKYRYLFEKSLKNKNKLNIATLIVLVDYYNDLGEINKLNEYLTILSSKIIDDICAKSFYSFGDNQNEKLNKNWILNSILSQNNSKYFSDQLTTNANMISNLFKRKKDFFGEINLGIQKLEMNNHPDALYLKELKNQYNNNPTKILKEEISQQETKIIGNRIVEYDDLCNFNYNDIINSIDETEIIADLISYEQEKYNTENYAITFHRHQKSNVITQAFLEEDKKLQSNKTLNSSFFEILFRLFEENKIDFNEKINTFYIIPSGKSNLINFSALSLAFEEKLGREINIHVINSLSDIPKIKKEKRKSIENLILVGDIDYDKTTNANSINKESQIRGIKLNKSIENSGIPTWSYLPGTKKEIENIGKVTMSNGVKTKILSNRTATEINFKKALSHKYNSIVHIATHGYFFPDNPSNELEIFFANHQNPLIRSGLILSGANDNWNNKKLVDQDRDGILTGEEISYMDLSNVELVVLSACDTGLGDVTNLEGINGLQRAFKLAGANKLIMSLWKVPDKETSEFFKHFYKFLLEDKLSINKAFRETQKVMHKKYDPYYWASFVLLE